MPTPVSISSNFTGLSIAEETTLKALPGENGNPGAPVWYALEPNTFADFGATFSSVARETINATRQRLFGTITDESAKGGFNFDLTQRNFTRQLQGFFFADALEKPCTNPFNGTQVPFTSVSATQYIAAAGLGGFLAGSLVYAKGFGVSTNNGLKHLTASAAGALTTDSPVAVEAGPPATATLETVGFRGAAGDLKLTVVGANVQIGSTALDFTTLGLIPGEFIYIGGDAAINRWLSSGGQQTGFARISAIAAHTLTLDFTDWAPVNDADPGGAQKIDIYYGKVLRNAPDPTLVKRRTYNIERTLGDDGTGIQSEYLIGAVPNTFSLNFATAAKLSADVEYMGMDVITRTGATGVKPGTRGTLPGEAAFNTTHDVALSRMYVVDPLTLNPTSLYAFISQFKLEINNGATPNKAIGVLGGFDVSEGDFAVSGTATAYFATVAAVAAIRNNSPVGLMTILARQNAGIVFDIPLLSLGGGGNKITKDRPIEVDLQTNAAKAPQGYTLLAGFFEYLPTVAMP